MRISPCRRPCNPSTDQIGRDGGEFEGIGRFAPADRAEICGRAGAACAQGWCVVVVVVFVGGRVVVVVRGLVVVVVVVGGNVPTSTVFCSMG